MDVKDLMGILSHETVTDFKVVFENGDDVFGCKVDKIARRVTLLESPRNKNPKTSEFCYERDLCTLVCPVCGKANAALVPHGCRYCSNVPIKCSNCGNTKGGWIVIRDYLL